MNEGHHAGHPRHARRPRDWTRIHHSPLFWLGALLFVAAIGVYVWSDDLAWRPRVEHRQAP